MTREETLPADDETSMNLMVRPIVIAEKNLEGMALLTRRIRATTAHYPVIGFPAAQGAIDYLEQALRLPTRTALPGILFADALLPGIDGFALTSWIRRQPALDSVQIYLLTPSSHSDAAQRARDLGANGILPKLPSAATLTNLLQTLDSPTTLAA
jgi:CheY-like chemotaxis protein